MKVVVAPDSFKGSAMATEVAHAIARGWSSERPSDDVVVLPQADGGEGTLEVLAAALSDATFHSVGYLNGPRGQAVDGIWLRLPDGTAVVELATVCGLSHYAPLDPLGASTWALGELLDAVVHLGSASIMVALGGSASTDAGAGALSALGLQMSSADGGEAAAGGRGLLDVRFVDRSGVSRPPAGGARLLTDVNNPLLGPSGAAVVFGPQKGASPQDVRYLEEGVERFASLLGGEPDRPGSGAAGGTAYGLVAGWGATIVSGARTVADLTGLTRETADADVLITGEGQFDPTSLRGKVVGHALALPTAPWTRKIVIAGNVVVQISGVSTFSLSDLAGSAAAAMANPLQWLQVAAAAAARTVSIG